MIDKRVSARGVHRVKNIEQESGDLICMSECDAVSDLYRIYYLTFHSFVKLMECIVTVAMVK